MIRSPFLRKVFVLIFLLQFFQGHAQETKGRLSSTRLVNLKIMVLKPEAKQKVSMVFRAEFRDGEPVWDLKKDELQITENGHAREILSVESISRNKPIYVSVVIDHSGSMMYQFTIENLIKWFRKDTLYISPLEYAKMGSLQFVTSFNMKKDFTSVIGFGSTVDLIIPLSNDTTLLLNNIRKIKIDGGTALYDGIMEGMQQLHKKEGVRIVVALTDGFENASGTTLEKMLQYSNKNNIPIYMIGLGGVDKDTLTYIAEK
jgi:Ca-activated chloride channel family protein